MPLVPPSEIAEETTQAIRAMHMALAAVPNLTSGQAVDAVAELLGLVLINAIDDRTEIAEALRALMADITAFIDTHYPTAAAVRSLEKTSTKKH